MSLHEQSTQHMPDKARDEKAFADACARARRLARPGSLVYLVSDFQHLGTQAIQHLSHLTRHCEVRAIVVNDPIEHALPNTSSLQTVSVSDGKNQQRWVLGDSKEQDQYKQWRDEHNRTIYEMLRKNNIARFSVSAGLPLDDQLQSMQQEKRLELN